MDAPICLFPQNLLKCYSDEKEISTLEIWRLIEFGQVTFIRFCELVKGVVSKSWQMEPRWQTVRKKSYDTKICVWSYVKDIIWRLGRELVGCRASSDRQVRWWRHQRWYPSAATWREPRTALWSHSQSLAPPAHCIQQSVHRTRRFTYFIYVRETLYFHTCTFKNVECIAWSHGLNGQRMACYSGYVGGFRRSPFLHCYMYMQCIINLCSKTNKIYTKYMHFRGVLCPKKRLLPELRPGDRLFFKKSTFVLGFRL